MLLAHEVTSPTVSDRSCLGGAVVSNRYFKLISTFEGREDWIISEFLAGRARYGWSPPGADLRDYLRGVKPWEEWPEDIRWAWPPHHIS